MKLRSLSLPRTVLMMLAIMLLAAGIRPAQADEKSADEQSDRHLQDALVKIYTVASRPDYFRPWTMSGPRQSTGSGCVIDGKRILTNAHVVSHAAYVQVRRNGDGKRYQARVEHAVHDADLAILTVDDPSFFEGIEPIKFGKLPAAQSDVAVYGFPRGGDALSVTKGVVSRIENQLYSHSGLHLLAGQIDAAVNPGNSGGPVLQDGRLVGVVMQANRGGENQGYMVPVDVVERVFKDLEDGRYDGFPRLGLRVQNMENPAAKSHFGLPEGVSGSLVVDVLGSSTSSGILQSGDVILEVEGRTVGDDGKFAFRGNERNSWQMLVQAHQIGESVALKIWRDGKSMEVEIPLQFDVHSNRRISGLNYETKPRFLVYGGMVFAPVTENLLRRFGKSWRDDAPRKLVYMLDYNNEPTEELREWVVLQSVLASDVNRGYHSARFLIVESVNGEKVADLNHFAQIVDSTNAERLVITSDLGYEVILDTTLAKAEHDSILKRYGIRISRAL